MNIEKTLQSFYILCWDFRFGKGACIFVSSFIIRFQDYLKIHFFHDSVWKQGFMVLFRLFKDLSVNLEKGGKKNRGINIKA